MTKNEDIAKELKTRLSELTARLAEIDGELRKPLSVAEKLLHGAPPGRLPAR